LCRSTLLVILSTYYTLFIQLNRYSKQDCCISCKLMFEGSESNICEHSLFAMFRFQEQIGFTCYGLPIFVYIASKLQNERRVHLSS
uniref:Uncharacterized protein n=1 Tax=Triticum urartu TaxID=4572 RepID=A0A8R7VCU3_TRIUA